MQKLFSQHKRILQKAIGYILIPGILIASYFIFHMKDVNFTGIINHPTYGNIMKILCLFLWFYLNWLCYEEVHIPGKKVWFPVISLFAISAVFIPYTVPSALSSNLHVLFSDIAFLLFNGMILYSDLYDQKRLMVFIMLCIPSFLICIVSMSVTGIAEIAYTVALSIYLTIYAKEKPSH